MKKSRKSASALASSSSLSVPGTIVMEGPLSKWTNLMQGWQFRWFVLDESAGILSYFTVIAAACSFFL
jgi:hypothetical protein